MDIRQAIGFITGKAAKHPYPEHMQDARKIAADGIVLLKNEGDLLPLAEKELALFGAGAVDTIVCGSGSGYVMAPYTINVMQGLENAGIQITSKNWLKRYQEASKKANKEDKTLSKLDRSWSGLSILIDDIEVTDADIKESSSAKTALYVVRRNAGENHDRRAKKGDYYLSDREMDNIKKIAASFEHTIIVLNTCVIDANFIEEIEGIDAALLLGQAGMEAGNALADILTGKSSPSGHLTDTWAKNYQDNPASATFGSNDGNNLQEDYVEDIFVGYRYFDSFGVEPLYPFGYGLSYGKTKALAAGEAEELTLRIPTESMASYDMETAAFIMEAGDYLIRLGSDSKNTAVAALLCLDATARLRQVSNQLQADHEMDVLTTPQACIERVQKETAEARNQAESGNLKMIQLSAADCQTVDGAAKPVEKRVSGKGNAKATFIDVVEKRVPMADFVDSLDEEVLFRLVAGAADEVPHSVPKRTNRKYKPVGGPTSSGSTTALYVDALGIPNWKVTDGPAGCHLPFMGVTGYPVGMVLAQTWDNDLSDLMGSGIGKELEAYSHSIILGPGMNIHRDPLGGRAFEYFSEDPLLSGKMAAAMTIGVQKTPGAGVSIKHFATNNQEEDRTRENNTVTERALREIYLRGFEICVREADPKTVMTSYNCLNGEHTSSSYELITNVLRGEWGFRGLVMTDWGSKSQKHLDLAAGNDLIMGGYRSQFLKAAVHGTPAEFADNGYVREQEFKVYGGFFKNVVEFWNAFEPDAQGPDRVTTTVASGVELSDKVQKKTEEGIATVTENADGSKTVTYRGYNRGQYLDMEDVKTCATRTLEQLADSVSYRLMTK